MDTKTPPAAAPEKPSAPADRDWKVVGRVLIGAALLVGAILGAFFAIESRAKGQVADIVDTKVIKVVSPLKTAISTLQLALRVHLKDRHLRGSHNTSSRAHPVMRSDVSGIKKAVQELARKIDGLSALIKRGR